MNILMRAVLESQFGLFDQSIWRFDTVQTVASSALENVTAGRDSEMVGHQTKLPFFVPSHSVLVIIELSGICSGSPVSGVAQLQVFADQIDGLTKLRFVDLIYQKRFGQKNVPMCFTEGNLVGLKIQNQVAASVTYEMTMAGFLLRLKRAR